MTRKEHVTNIQKVLVIFSDITLETIMLCYKVERLIFVTLIHKPKSTTS